MCHTRNVSVIIMCAICAVGCIEQVEPPAADSESSESEEDTEVISQEIGGYLPMNSPRSETRFKCKFTVQHGVFISTPYAKVRVDNCNCKAQPVATVSYGAAGLKSYFGEQVRKCGLWNQVTVPTGFDPHLIGSSYIIFNSNGIDRIHYSVFR